MGSFSIWHILLVAVVVLLLFGRGRMSDFMGDFAKGIKMFKKGLTEDDPTDKTRVVHDAEVVNVRKEEPVTKDEKVHH
jgi:sec-independent protein translocase protein TatA